MATLIPPVDPKADATIDVGAIWRKAIDRYEKITMIKIESLTGVSNVDEILNDIQERETKFKVYRHDGSKFDKFRTLVSRSLNLVTKVGDIVTSATSTVRKQILPARWLVMTDVYTKTVLSSHNCYFHGCPLPYSCMVSIF